jgi:hypothetical protein
MNLLVLLIGGNNIANYALIDYFKKNIEYPFDKVILIYTSQSKNSADNIKSLQRDVEFIDVNLEAESRNLKIIEQIIKEKLNLLKPKFVHLNYTGGTKPMSLGAYLAVSDMNCKKIFSDISPDSSKLTFASGEVYPKNCSIAEGVELDIEKLYKLHNITLKSLQREVSEFYSSEMIQYLYEKSVNAKNYEKFWKFWDKGKGKLEDVIVDFPIKFDFEKIDFEEFKKFVRGRWLEEYVFNSLKDEDFTDIAWNVEGSIKGRDFELDLVITKGHQTYIISCTTEEDKLFTVKQKAFEASMRAEQIGGIRAKPISVSLLNKEKLEELEKDVLSYVGKSKFSFIGREDLINPEILKEKLKAIFK